MSATLKAQYQARINAATTATKPLLLAILRVIGEKLGCDMTNLNTVAPQVADTAAAGTSLIDLSYIAKALPSAAGGNAATVTLPFAVEAGDVIYVDELGVPFRNRPFDYQLSVLPAVTYKNGRLVIPVDGFTGSGTSTNGNNVGFCYKLADGNILLGTPGVGGAYVRVLSPKMDAVLSTLTVGLNSPSDQLMGSYAQFLACVQHSANTFRIYYLAPYLGDDSTSERNRLVFRTFTYTPASNALGGMTSPTTLFSTSGELNLRGVTDTYQLFDYWVGANYKLVGLHVVSGAVVDYTAYAATSAIGFAALFTPADGNARWLIRAGTTVYIYRADSNVAVAAPANLAAPLAYTQRVHLGGGLFLLSNTAARNVRLVQFSADASACDVYTVGTDLTSAFLHLKIASYIRRGSTYTIFNSAGMAVLVFSYTIGSAPTVLQTPMLTVRASWMRSQQITPSTEVIVLTMANLNPSYFDLIFRCTAACLDHTAVSVLGVCKAAAPANTAVAISLSPMAVAAADSVVNNVPSGFGYRVLGTPDHAPLFDKSSGGHSTVNGHIDAVAGGATQAKAILNSQNQPQAYTSVSNSAVLFDQGGRVSLEASKTSGAELFIVTPRLFFRQYGYSNSTAYAMAYIETNEPFMAFCIGSLVIVNSGSLL